MGYAALRLSYPTVPPIAAQIGGDPNDNARQCRAFCKGFRKQRYYGFACAETDLADAMTGWPFNWFIACCN